MGKVSYFVIGGCHIVKQTLCETCVLLFMYLILYNIFYTKSENKKEIVMLVLGTDSDIYPKQFGKSQKRQFRRMGVARWAEHAFLILHVQLF